MPSNYLKVRMLDNLLLVERMLDNLLDQDIEKWNTLDVDYEPPRVERLWCEIDGGLRVMLHKIHPCEKALYHPHPWPAAIRVLSGQYEMGIAYGDSQPIPGSAGFWEVAKTILTTGAAYEMVHPEGWHYVRPLDHVSLSLMVIGRPFEEPHWDHSKFGKGIEHKPLSDDQRQGVLIQFKTAWASFRQGQKIQEVQSALRG